MMKMMSMMVVTTLFYKRACMHTHAIDTERVISLLISVGFIMNLFIN